MMQDLLMMSVQSAVLIAVLLLLRSAFEKRMAPTVLYGLWLLPAVRLLIPGSIASVFSFQNYISHEALRKTESALHQPAVVGTHPVQGDAVQPIAPAVPVEPITPIVGDAVTVPADAAIYLDMAAVLLILWVIGALTVLGYAAWKNVAFVRMAKKDAVLVEVECGLPVYLSEQITSPCLCGIFKPVILVNDETLMSEAHLAMALRHELAHYRVGDRFWAILRLVCCAVHWFNPLVWVAAKTSVQDCERACDHRVLKDATQRERETYGELLLSYLKKPAATKYSLLCASSPMGGDKAALRGRIALIGQKPVTKKLAAVLLAVCVAGTCLVACTSRVEHKETYQELANRAENLEFVLFNDGNASDDEDTAVAGRTLYNFLSTREWIQTDAENPASGTLVVYYVLNAEEGGTLAIRQNNGAYYADVQLAKMGDEGDEWGEQTFYEISEDDAWAAWAMTQMHTKEEFGSGGKYMVPVPMSDGISERHYFFEVDHTDDDAPAVYDYGTSYRYIESNLNELITARDGIEFLLEDTLGFIGFYGDTLGDKNAPHLYRTGDGGATWERIELPVGDITPASGYHDIRITRVSFADQMNGEVTVTFYHDSTDGALESTFTTTDGGKTFYTTGSRPMLPVLPELGEDAVFESYPADSIELEEGWQISILGLGDMTWSSDDESIATIDEKGMVTGISVGQTVIRGVGEENTHESVVIVREKGEVMWKHLISQLDFSLSYDPSSRMITFVIPREMDTANRNLHLDLWGTEQLSHDEYRVEHFMEGSEWVAGVSYSYPLPLMADYTQLRLDVQYGANGVSIDVKKVIDREALRSSIVFDAQAQEFQFTLPKTMDTGKLDLEIWGIKRLPNGKDDLQRDLMGDTVYEAGKTYTFSVAERKYETLIMEYAYPDTGIGSTQVSLHTWRGYQSTPDNTVD